MGKSPRTRTGSRARAASATEDGSDAAVLRVRPAARAFGGTEVGSGPPAGAAQAVIIPFPLEATVSYGSGTAKGPEAIIAASPQLEFFDEELWREPFREFGIATLEAPQPATPLAAALDQLARIVEGVLQAGKFPLVLGGEHALTAGAIRPFAQRHADLAVLQFDAHADLRDGYGGEPFSHAAAMRRVLDHANVRLVGVGLRNISAEEARFAEQAWDRLTLHWAKDRKAWRIDDIVAPLRGRPIYVSFDVDVLDAGLMPATGTPEPGGLSFEEAIALLKAAAQAGRLVGADVVEFAPIAGLHACDFTVAKLVYKLLTIALCR